MCTLCPARRRFLGRAALALPLVATAGCEMPLPVSEAEAARTGREAWEAIVARTPASADPAAGRLVARVASRLLDAGGHDARDWEVRTFAGDTVNAFALPGNRIGVYEGMVRLAADEGPLAAVIGHEIGHVEADHSRERMSAQVAGNAALRLVSWLLDLGEVELGQEIAGALGVGLEFGVLRPYGRGQEEADLLGLELMVRAGYAPEAAVALWERMDARRGRGGFEFLSTHPAPQSRIEALREAIAARG